MITLRINNIYTDIVGDLCPSLREEIIQELSFRPLGYQFSNLYNRWIVKDGKKVRRMWDGWRRQGWKKKNSTGMYFPTGLYSYVAKYLNAQKIVYVNEDLRVKPIENLKIKSRDGFIFRDYQAEVIQSASKITRGLIRIATGGGKTCCAGGIVANLKTGPVIFFVTSIDLLMQAKRDFESVLVNEDGTPLKIGQIGAGVVDITDINIMTVQTAVRALGHSWDKEFKFDDEDQDDDTYIDNKKGEIAQLLKTAKMIICDEVQHWRAETCQLVTRACVEAYYCYGMSATPTRDEEDDLVIHGCFGKIIIDISASYLIKKGWLMKPHIKIVHIKTEPSKFRHWQQIYKEQVVESELYNNVIVDIAHTYIKHGRLVLILITQIQHGKNLLAHIPNAVFLHGASSKDLRKETMDKLRNREISCIISTSIMDEGVDITSLDTVILGSQGKSKVRAMQRIGRIMRKRDGKKFATAIDFRIHQKYLLAHSIAREKMYRTEPEYEIEEIEL